MENRPAPVRSRPSKPTTRQVADLVKAGGADALTEATRRADAARYQEVRCRRRSTRVKGMPFEWTLNPYRGCTHGCHYCYARRYHTQFELGADDEFASIIFVKTNFVEVLRRELQSPCWTNESSRSARPPTAISRSRATTSSHAARSRRSASSAIRRASSRRDRWSCATRTCSPICQRRPTAPSTSACRASMRTSGASSSPARRIRCSACGRCASWSTRGIRAGVLMNPIVPGISSKPALLERTMKAIADHGARFVGCNVMYLEGGTRDHFMRWLSARSTRIWSTRYQRPLRRQVPAEGVSGRSDRT